MEATGSWLGRAAQSSLDLPHPAENDAIKTFLETKPPGDNKSNPSDIVPFRILIKSLEISPSSVPAVYTYSILSKKKTSSISFFFAF